MLTEELGLQIEGPWPLRAALTTFGAFFAVGIIPLLPFLLPVLTPEQKFSLSTLVTALAFFGIGMIKGLVLQRSVFKAGLETLLIGGAAAVLAYLVGVWLRRTFGVD